MGKVKVGQVWDTKRYGKVEIIEELPRCHFIGKFLNTGFVTKPSQAQAFYLGSITDLIAKKALNNSYGYWTVIKELPARYQPSGTCKRVVECQCVCGSVRVITLDSLTRKTSTNCGCVTREESEHFHKESGTRLYLCWLNMKARCKKRGDSCNFQEDWGTYLNFKGWALANGYKDNLILLRGTEDKPDVGDYKEGNCRWGTKTDNYYDWKLAESLPEEPSK